MGDGTPSGKTNEFIENRESSSDAALRGYIALGLTRKQDQTHDAIEPDTDGAGSHPYGG